MKKISAILLSLFLLTAAFSSVNAAEKSLSVGLNGQQIQFSNSAPIIEQGVTLVPLRTLLEKLDVQVKWNQATRTVSGSKEGLSFSMKIGSTDATANGKTVKLDAAPKQIKNVTYVPLRFAAETAGYQVTWNPSLRQVTLTSGNQSEGSQGYLWKVENKGNTVYLLGTVHTADKSMYPLRPEIEDAFKAADYLGVEIDFSTVVPEELQKLLSDLGYYNDGTTLKDHISAETYKKVTAMLKENEMPENSFNAMKPWFTYQQILNVLMAKKGLGFQEETGIDQYLMDKAVKEKKPIVALESADSQFHTFNNFSESLQEKLILQILDPNSLTPPIKDVPIEDTIKMWKDGDYNALLELVDSLRWDAEYFKGMQTDRNIEMAEKIKGFLNSDTKETYLIAVGAAHLPSDSGVVTLLEKEGFKVKNQ